MMTLPNRVACIFAVIQFGGMAAVSAGAQTTIKVPADQPTIQAAINAANSGDTVLVSPGKFTESIDFKGKALTVTSLAGPSQTTIDGGQSGVVVTFQTFETRTSVLHGFTLTDNAPPLPIPVNVVAAGILVVGANPTITGNVITANRGYGIDLTNSGALISGNTIRGTLTAGDPAGDFGCDYIDGSGIYVTGGGGIPGYSVQIENNLIEFNAARCYGGAIFYNYATSGFIANNTIRYNTALGPGGAVYVYASPVSFVQNLFVGNTSGAGGGAIYLQIISDSNSNTGPLNQFLVNNTFVGNTIELNPKIFDFYTDGSQVAFGGYVSQVGFFNNIFVSGDTYGQIACDPTYQYLSGNPPIFSNNDSLNFGGPRASGWCPDQTGSNGNISANPMFVNQNGEPFHLQTVSPAISVGDAAAPDLPTSDLDGQPRTQNGKVDLGVYEGGVAQSGVDSTPNFSISSAPSSLVITNGQSGQITLTISPSGGLIGALSLSCPTAPSGISCFFPEPILGAGGDNQPLTASVTISASVPAASLATPPSEVISFRNANRLRLFALLYSVFPAILCVELLLAIRRHRLISVAPFTAVLAAVLFAQSCGGGSQSPAPPPPPSNSKSFTIGITVTSSGNVTTPSQTLNLPVTVNL